MDETNQQKTKGSYGSDGSAKRSVDGINRSGNRSMPVQTKNDTAADNFTPISYNTNTTIGEETQKFLAEKDILLEKGDSAEAVRDPLFAAKVLEQEQSPRPRPDTQTYTSDKTSKEAVENPDKKRSKIPTIRTYQKDVADALKKNKTSMVQMVLSERDRRERIKEGISPTSKKNLPFFVLSIGFASLGILALLGGVFYFFYTKENTVTQIKAPDVPGLIFTETQKEMNITNLSKNALENALSEEVRGLDIRLDFIEQVYFTKDTNVSLSPTLAKEDTVKTSVTTEQFFTALESGMPDSLLRSLSDTFMFGIHSFNGNQPFIILKTKFFENTFAGLLRWEKDMARDILPIFGSTAADTSLFTKKFQDIVIKNRDLRALIDENGEIALLYSFFDRQTVIIATAEETLDEVITRLNRPAQAN